MSELCDLGAVRLRAGVGAKEFSPVEILESCISRIEAVNPVLNALVATCYERAKAEAKTAEAAVMRGDTLGALHGLPIGIKDLQDTEGLRTTYGSPIFRDHVPVRDERTVAAIREAGAIVVAKTNTPEFGSGGNTTNEVYGTTANAFDTSLTCGGSSGGSGVALATSMLPLCSGSDTGGSLRKPAAWSGVVGFRPSPGLVPSDRRKLGWQPLSVLGPMGRNVEDTCLLLGAMASADSSDPFAWPMDSNTIAALSTPAPVDLSKLRVAFSANLGFARLAPSIQATFDAKVAAFSHVFASSEIADPDMTGIVSAYRALRATNFIAGYKEHYERDPMLLGPNTRANYEEALTYSLADVALAHRDQTRIYRDLQAFFKRYDVLITPCQLMSPYPKDQLFPKQAEGMEMVSYMDSSMMTCSISMVGHPAVSLPCGYDRKDLPFALQIVGPHRRDAFTLSVAHALEAVFESSPELARPLPDLARLIAESALLNTSVFERT